MPNELAHGGRDRYRYHRAPVPIEWASMLSQIQTAHDRRSRRLPIVHHAVRCSRARARVTASTRGVNAHCGRAGSSPALIASPASAFASCTGSTRWFPWSPRQWPRRLEVAGFRDVVVQTDPERAFKFRARKLERTRRAAMVRTMNASRRPTTPCVRKRRAPSDAGESCARQSLHSATRVFHGETRETPRVGWVTTE